MGVVVSISMAIWVSMMSMGVLVIMGLVLRLVMRSSSLSLSLGPLKSWLELFLVFIRVRLRTLLSLVYSFMLLSVIIFFFRTFLFIILVSFMGRSSWVLVLLILLLASVGGWLLLLCFIAIVVLIINAVVSQASYTQVQEYVVMPIYSHFEDRQIFNSVVVPRQG